MDRQCLQPVFVKKQLQYLPHFESFDLEQNHGSICPADDYLSLSPGSLGSQQRCDTAPNQIRSEQINNIYKLVFLL